MSTQNSISVTKENAYAKFFAVKNLLFFLLLFLITLNLSTQLSAQSPPSKQWDKDFGGDALDDLYFVQQTSDGGYILGGYSLSGISGDKTQASQGFYDYWVLKIDVKGVKQWDKDFGGNNTEYLTCLQQTSDGGYIL